MPKILIVDDDKNQLLLYEVMLNNFYSIITTTSSTKALEIIKNDKIDLILMDIVLDNGESGIETAKKILKIKFIPIIFISAYSNNKITEKAAKISSYGFIVKGAKKNIILSSINMALKLHKAKKKLQNKAVSEALSQKRGNLLYSISKITDLLLNQENIDKVLSQITKILGQISEQHRVYIFKAKYKNDNCYISQKYEWVKDPILAEKNNPELQNLNFSKTAPFSYPVLKQGKIVDKFVEDLPKSEELFLKKQSITSILLVPIMLKKKLWGFIGFDNCKEKYRWTEDEKNSLTTITSAVSNALLRKETQKYLQLSKDKNKALLHAIPDMMFIINHQGVFIDFFSNNKSDLLAKTEDFIGKSISKVLGSKLSKLTLDKIDYVKRNNKIATYTYSVYINDEKKYYDTRMVPYRNNFLAIVRDITERQKAVNKIKKSEDKYTKILNVIPDLVSLHDKDMNILYSNWKGFGEINKEKQVFNTKCYKTYRGFNKICPDCQAKKVLKTNESFEIEKELPDGTWIDLRVLPIISAKERETTLFVEWVRDITKIKKEHFEKIRLEKKLQQSQKLEAIGTLAGGIAHDFNNILTPILGYTELLELTLPQKGNFLSSLKEITKASHRAKDLIEQLLTFSRKSEDKAIVLNIIPIVKETLKFLSSTIPSTIEIKKEINPKIGNIKADPTKIHQILMNLGINAYHAMEGNSGITAKGKLIVSVDQKKFSEGDLTEFINLKPGKYINISITDNGKGIPKETLSHIFDPFFTTKQKGKGTGMGLSVVHGIVNSYEGEIKVYSEINIGTTFNIYLPVIDSEVDPTKEEIAPAVKGNYEKIVLIDDRKYITKMMHDLLIANNYNIYTFNDSKEALDDIIKKKDYYDIIISDFTMPKINGIQLAKALYSQKNNTPVIILSGHAHNIDLKEISNTNIKKIMHKPVMIKVLLNEIYKIIQKIPN